MNSAPQRLAARRLRRRRHDHPHVGARVARESFQDHPFSARPQRANKEAPALRPAEASPSTQIGAQTHDPTIYC